jgi:hypothetical protein
VHLTYLSESSFEKCSKPTQKHLVFVGCKRQVRPRAVAIYVELIFSKFLNLFLKFTLLGNYLWYIVLFRIRVVNITPYLFRSSSSVLESNGFFPSFIALIHSWR